MSIKENGVETNQKEKKGISEHDPPVLSQTPVDNVPVYTVANEEGYFPTGYSKEILTSVASVQLYQIHPKYAHRQNHMTESIIADGTLTLRDPSPGTPSDVVLIGECDDLIFFVMKDDAVIKISQRMFTIFLPDDCIAISLPEDVEEHNLLHIEGLFAVRTKFHDESKEISNVDATILGGKFGDLVPDDDVSKKIYAFSVVMANKIHSYSGEGAKYIAEYGQSKRENVTETGEKEVSKAAIYAATAARKLGKFTHKAVVTVSDTVSNTLGKGLASTIAIRESDGKIKRANKGFIISSALAFSEIAGSVADGYNLVSRAAKDEAVAYMDLKYGHDASELTRQTLGATINFGNTALSARRVLNVRKILTSSATVAIKESFKAEK